MNRIVIILIAMCVWACSPSATETTATTDSTTVTIDSTTLVASLDDEPVEEDASMYDADPGDTAPRGQLDGQKYEIYNQSYLVSNPFDTGLDSAALMDLLGEEAVITSTITEGGQDEMGPYDGYTFYELKYDKTEMSFYSYSGKHNADIYTNKITVANGIAVGMKLEDFIAQMELPEEARQATSFIINDDYGFMGFYFDHDGNLTSISVHYEEGD